jgi:hypothetical protein
VPALDHLGVAGDDLHPGRGGGSGHRIHLAAKLVGSEPLLEHERHAQRQRPRARDGEVVDGAVDRQLPDRAAGEAQRLDHEAVGGERQPEPIHRHGPGVSELAERLAAQRRRKQPLDQRLGGLPAGAVRHRDLLVLEPRPLRPCGLDDLQDPVLPPRGRRLGRRHTSSFSRANRP